MRHLMLIATSSTVTHLNERELGVQIKCALDQGVTRKQVREVLQMAPVLGMHGFMLGAPIPSLTAAGPSKRRPSTAPGRNGFGAGSPPAGSTRANC
ncbi:hypothetical protein [Pseudomonas aeruginosa]|uniref:hypothetical protein n=1 Tax=Pseudomonas aeruginosa TaxID=287 RepID=UPI0018DF3AF9|nr:hypothetical protein [Pseudomonas aeruginosa]QPZ62296.1 hypothetical protein I9X26_13245 [Pseudomonas aeruginosa]HBO3954667.1 hypothetical protein [Pseudomonas aeruginosa]